MSKPNNNQQQEYRRVRTPKKGEIPGVVEQIMGHGKLKVSDEKADVIWRYTKTESNWLERKGYLKM